MGDKKYDPIVDDPCYWRYQKLVEDWSAHISKQLRLEESSKENFQLVTAYFAASLYRMGYEDAERFLKEVQEKKKIIN